MTNISNNIESWGMCLRRWSGGRVLAAAQVIPYAANAALSVLKASAWLLPSIVGSLAYRVVVLKDEIEGQKLEGYTITETVGRNFFLAALSVKGIMKSLGEFVLSPSYENYDNKYALKGVRSFNYHIYSTDLYKKANTEILMKGFFGIK